MSVHLIDSYKEKYVKVKEQIKKLEQELKQAEFELDLYENVTKDLFDVDADMLTKERRNLHGALTDQRYLLYKIEIYIKQLEEKIARRNG